MPPKRYSKSKLFYEFGTEIDEEGRTDTDYNEELQDEFDVDEDEQTDIDSELETEDEVLDIDVDEEDIDDENIEENIEVDLETDITTTDDGCLYDFSKKKKKKKSNLIRTNDDYDDDEVFDDDTIEIDINSKFVPKEDRITGNVLTKYERVRILAERSKQLMLGAKPMLKGTQNIHPKDIARLELERNVIPFKVHRKRPDGKIEEWSIAELKIVN